MLIGPAGVFVIETKTISKRNDIRRNEVRFDGQFVLVNGFTPDRDPIVQVGANARWVGKLLKGEPPQRVTIQPVVLYPGWWVESTSTVPPAEKTLSTVWVMNDKQFFAAIGRASGQLTATEVSTLAALLRMHVRTKVKAFAGAR